MVDILYTNISPVWKSGTSCLMEVADLYPSVMVLWDREIMEAQRTQCWRSHVWESREFAFGICGNGGWLWGSGERLVLRVKTDVRPPGSGGKFTKWSKLGSMCATNISSILQGVACLPSYGVILQGYSRCLVPDPNQKSWFMLLETSGTCLQWLLHKLHYKIMEAFQNHCQTQLGPVQNQHIMFLGSKSPYSVSALRASGGCKGPCLIRVLALGLGISPAVFCITSGPCEILTCVSIAQARAKSAALFWS